MSYGPLPKRIDPRKLAEREVRFESSVDVDQLPRLVECLALPDGKIEVDLQFSVDEQRIRTIVGSARGDLHMACQRCLEPVEVEVAATFNLAIAASEEAAKQLPRYYDPLIVEDEEIELLPVLEEELILSLPMVPYHQDCSIQTSFGDDAGAVDADGAESASEKPNPFSVLAKLKGQ
ncbi:YceD family protein [Marinobacterium arenosum]|uniref:YceD family protein n=1 Tax=Marinobacterium arenosum TaxID=2862496 RepID=UPI001C97D43E|nr:YceD family protein [Marinobacterium arenosum]MBY4677173.1 YceD family protein [Marinobacterium arenosum]